jgi:hypothetical protein
MQELELAMMTKLNQRHLQSRITDPVLSARMKSFETAFGMQAEMPEVFDLSGENRATLKLYGLEPGSTSGFAWQCLVARRLAERGVRFVELIDVGSSNNWDAHGDMQTHAPLAKNVDQPIAGLIKDLRQRGMLDETLVVWTTDFHATILHLMGLDHERLTFRHTGRDYRLTDVHGRVVKEVMA